MCQKVLCSSATIYFDNCVTDCRQLVMNLTEIARP